MLKRTLNLPDDESLFLFGPRGTGKTTYLKQLPYFSDSIYINLLKASDENRFRLAPDALYEIASSLSPEQHIIIDEIQKLPKLLDIVHDLIEETEIKFILTGSSARKLKHGGANLLAGRAFVYELFPFTVDEIGTQFNLQNALSWGMLPKLFAYDSDLKKRQFLESYVNIYLKEEIINEQLIRELDPFRYFLPVAAQSNGKILNFAKIARDVGIADKTVQKYYAILEDTLLGFFLPPFHHSFRKRLSKSPKFYFFDPGVVRALMGRLTLPLCPSTHEYGNIFEHFVILQCKQIAKYYQLPYDFSYLRTKDDAEIDLVVERPGERTLFIEIKSTDNVLASHVKTLQLLAKDFGACEAICLSCDPYPKKIGDVRVLPWQAGIAEYFGTSKTVGV